MLKQSLLVVSAACLLSASTTMCYKKNHLDPSTISSVILQGGKCDGKYSVEDMKKNGYKVDSMKLQNATDGLTYIYVFKKEQTVSQKVVTTGVTNEQLKTQLKVISEEKELKKEKEELHTSLQNGQKIYESTCKRCHGDGSVRAYNSARALRDLSLEDMEIAIRDYSNGSRDNGMAVLMQPYANLVTTKDIQGIYNYIQTLK